MAVKIRVGYNTVALAALHPQQCSSPGAALFGSGEFIAALENVSIGNLRALWLPSSWDTTTTTSPPSGGRVWTYDASIAARISVQGNGVVVAFDGTNNFGTTPDTTDLTFIEPVPFSIAALANVTNTAARRTLITRRETGVAIEWEFYIESDDTLGSSLRDGGGPFATRASDAAITMGSLRLFGMSYSGVGGATAANGITHYQDAAVIASTATNDALYVAMANQAVQTGLGADAGSAATRFQGDLGFAAVYAANLSLAQHLAIKQAVNRYYGLTL